MLVFDGSSHLGKGVGRNINRVLTFFFSFRIDSFKGVQRLERQEEVGAHWMNDGYWQLNFEMLAGGR